ncbi:HAD-IIB family hydrolase [Photobacterium sp. DNB23_23_1]|uniref:HAD-IIB family hydrolase n=1 Tax=Photobacterium pectinilyticum TaxID=2906793 RepID=A0ABT1MWN2_9GAMM|nr:HAD-IIB family hydrolase [Photobacterium sp. ZSDE20]MCQ1056893.1 HAD-IIB family hydrolase [Photobacterium sp. ZSDE20]MDD1821028.1 HAD-IIB family hydrolase [Photobacterium sp. ZSDE20]
MNSDVMSLSPEWSKIEWVLTDVDDTLTWQGQLPPETLIALQQLRDAGKKVVAVTGACAGWGDHIAQLWPVDAVLAENGAVIMEKKDGYLTLRSEAPINEIRSAQQRLKAEVEAILVDYSDLKLTLDQAYRVCEVAIDIGQNCPKADSQIVSEIVGRIHALGANATASSIHINAWYGEHSKKATATAFLKEKGLTEQQIKQTACYVGDSMNDQYMFELLPMSVGVANIKHYWDQLQFKPQVVMSKPGGFGFAEFTGQLLALK